MDKENHFNNTNGLWFPADFPYDFASPSSTEPESDDDDVAGLTRRFSRSAFLQEHTYNLKEKRVFSGSPESTLGWAVSGRSQAPTPPPFVKADEDEWNLIYAAAGQVARMRMNMNYATAAGTAACNAGGGANKNHRGLLRPPSSFAQPHSSPWGQRDGDEFYRQPQFRQNGVQIRVTGGCGCGGGVGSGGGPRPPSLRHSPWPAQRLQPQKPCNSPAMKPVVLGGSGGGCDGGGGGAAAGKRECAGTGVFFPRRYCNNPPESRKRQACSPAILPARMIQSSNKNMDAIKAQPRSQAQANINGGFVPHYELLMDRRNAMIQAAQQRRSNSIVGGAVDAPANNPEVLLPQEWTY